MSKFNIGDKVRILGNRIDTDIEGFIESIDTSDSSLTFYDIKDMNGKIIFNHISENILESLPITEFEKVMTQFTSDKENTQLFQEYDKSYMEGVISHMNEAGIDPETNDPKDFIYFQEMAGRIPEQIKVYKKGKEILIIAVGDRENRGEAHFHVYRSETDLRKWKNGACLLFKENKYFDHGDNSETLTKDELNAMIEYLKSKPAEGLQGDTYWQYLIYLWNGNNYDWRISIDTPIPDYDYKTITRYKETK